MSRAVRSPLCRGVVLGALLAAGLAGGGCSNKGEPSAPKQADWPPRTGRNDKLAAALPAGAKVELSVPAEGKVQYSGLQRGSPAGFVPDPVSFHVTAGELVSKVGSVQKRATIKGWMYVYSDAGKSQVSGWGPRAVGGEVIVSNLFLRKAPADLYAENHFDVEDFGPDFTLIKLDPAKGHQLCLVLRPSGQEAAGGSDLTKVINKGEIWGACAESQDASPAGMPFLSTAGYVGTKATIADCTYLRKADGWYNGPRRVGGE